MGELVISLNRGAINTRAIEWLSKGFTLSNEELEDMEVKLLRYADDAETRSHVIYLGTEEVEPQPAVLDILNAKVLSLPRWRDVPLAGTSTVGYYETVQMTGWNALQTYISDMRGLAQKGQNRTLMNETAAFRFVIENGATQIGPRIAVAAAEQAAIAKGFIRTMAVAQLAILLGNAGVFVFSILYFQRLLQHMAQERLTLFNIFLALPVRAVIDCGSRPNDIADDNENDEDTDWQVKVRAIEERLARKSRKKEAAKMCVRRTPPALPLPCPELLVPTRLAPLTRAHAPGRMRNSLGPDAHWPASASMARGEDDDDEEDRRSEESFGASGHPAMFATSEMVQKAAERLHLTGHTRKAARTVGSDGAANYQAMAPLVLTGALPTPTLRPGLAPLSCRRSVPTAPTAHSYFRLLQLWRRSSASGCRTSSSPIRSRPS